MNEYQAAAATEVGAKVLQDLLRRFGYDTRSTFVSGDPHATSWHEGQRAVVTYIRRRLDEAPEDRNTDG